MRRSYDFAIFLLSIFLLLFLFGSFFAYLGIPIFDKAETVKSYSFGSLPESLVKRASQETTFSVEIPLHIRPTNEQIKNAAKKVADIQAQGPSFNQPELERSLNNVFLLSYTEDRTISELLENRPLTKELLELILSDIKIIAAREQARFLIPMPDQINKEITVEVSTDRTPSYPSSYLTQVFVMFEVLNKLMPAEESILFDTIKSETVYKTQRAGLHTQLDADFASDLAEEYKRQVLEEDESFLEKLTIVNEEEWLKEPELKMPTEAPRVDAAITPVTNASVEESGILFQGEVASLGQEPINKPMTAILEIDRFADGNVDFEYEFSTDWIPHRGTTTLSYFMDFKSEGNHAYRFILKPDGEVAERKYLNNYGAWHSFTIER